MKRVALKQLTIRGFDAAVERRIRELARAEGLSLNQAALKLLRRGAGLEEPEPSRAIGDAIDDLVGTWTEKEAREFNDALEAFEVVDEEMWR